MCKGGNYIGKVKNFLRIGELAELSGVSSRTIDYYTQLGLISEEVRTSGKHRLYSEESIRDIKIVKELQKQHYTLDEISSLFKSKVDGEVFEKVLQLRKHLDEIQKEVAELYPALQGKGENPKFKEISAELLNKGMQVMQALIIVLGDGHL